MKWLIFFGVCIAVVLSAPVNDNDDDQDNQQNQNRRRFQTLSLKLVDDNDGQKNNLDRDDDDNNDDRRDDVGALRELVRDPYEVDGPQVSPKNTFVNDAKNSHLDLLAKELERLSASPSKNRNINSRLYDLGSLHFKYVAPQEKLQHYLPYSNKSPYVINEKLFQHLGDREAYHYNGDKHPYHYYSDRYEHPFVNQYKPDFAGYVYSNNFAHGYLRDRPDDDDNNDNNNNNDN